MNFILIVISVVLFVLSLICVVAGIAVNIANNSKGGGKRKVSTDELKCLALALVLFLISYVVWP